MKKFYMVVSALMLLTFFTMDRSIQEESSAGTINHQEQLAENNSKAVCGVIITWNGNAIYENYIGLAANRNKAKRKDLTNFRVASIHDFEIISGLKITVFLSKEVHDFVNSFSDLFTVKTPPDTKLKRKHETPIDATVAKYKESK